MTHIQSQAVWELCRQGLQLAAYEAEHNWDQGQIYRLDLYLQVPRWIRSLIERCNWEVTRERRDR